MEQEQLDVFETFLKERKAASKHFSTNWRDRKMQWIESVDDLYHSIHLWLLPYITRGLIRIDEQRKYNLYEPFVGQYEIKGMDIYVGDDIITVIPIGTLDRDGLGRVTMSCSGRHIALVQKNWHEWHIQKSEARKSLPIMTASKFKEAVTWLILPNFELE